MRSFILCAAMLAAATSLQAASLPSAVTSPASDITATSATLNGTITANGARTKASFDFGRTSGYGTRIQAKPYRVSPSDGTTPVSAEVTGLSCGTIYHFRVRGTNRVGTKRGYDEVFTTAPCATPSPVAPAARTTAPTSVATGGATLNGAVTPGSATATITFEWGSSTAYGNQVAGDPGTLASSSTERPVSAALSGLACGSTYHFRVKATSSAGTALGANQAFTTLACPTTTPPAARTSAATSVTATGATLNGAVMPGSAAATVSFDWGPTTAYGSTAAATPATLAASSAETPVSAAFSGLACGSTYHFRVKATSSAGTALGSNQSFATASCGSPQPLACSSSTVHCVSATVRPEQEFSTIQAAVNVAVAGDTVLVHDGNYAGFVATRSGTATAPITIRAAGTGAVVDRPNSAGDGIRVSNASYVVVEGLTIQNIGAYGLAARGATATSPMRGIVFRDNTVRNCGSGTLGANIYASQVAHSLIEGNTSTGSTGHGIYVANAGSDNTVVRGNLLHGNGSNGLHLNGDESVGGDGLVSGAIIEDNIIHSNAANGINADGLQSSTVRNNLVYGNGRHALRAYTIDASAGPRDLVVVNNTFVVANGNTPVKFTEDLGGHTLFNNVLVNEGTSGGSIVVGTATGVRSDHNTFVNPGFSVNGGSTMLSISQWRAQAGAYDVSSKVTTQGEVFAAPASRDYRLRAGSVAANAGVASFNSRAAPADDIAGTARPLGTAHDHGSFENF